MVILNLGKAAAINNRRFFFFIVALYMPSTSPVQPFSILIPSWNNLDYLRCCIESLIKNSATGHQLIVHVNEGNDGTVSYLESKGILYTQTSHNAGVCKALNQAYTLAVHDYIVYMNDDMYALPRWDQALWDEITRTGHHRFYLSGTMIEPVDTGNKCVLAPYNYGRDIGSFDEERLLAEYTTLKKADWYGATWPPSVVHRELWEKVGGYSEEFSPGLYSDPDFSMKL